MSTKNQDADTTLVWRVVDGEALIVDLRSGCFFSLDPVGTEVWKGLQGGVAIAEIIRSIAAAYDVSADRVQSDVAELIADLRQVKLLE